MSSAKRARTGSDAANTQANTRAARGASPPPPARAAQRDDSEDSDMDDRVELR